MNWLLNFRENGMVEYLCEHGVGHYPERYGSEGAHGCDGCCERDDFPGKLRGTRSYIST